jgi:hypothetical protein
MSLTRSVIQILLMLLIGCAAVGLPLSIVVHLVSLAGIQPGGIALFIATTAGGFLAISVNILLVLRLPKWIIFLERDPKDSFRRSLAIFSGCPVWMKYITIVLYFYCLGNFAINMLIALATLHPGKLTSDIPIVIWRYVSGFWMLFYAAGLATLTTTYRKGFSALEREFFGLGPWG